MIGRVTGESQGPVPRRLFPSLGLWQLCPLPPGNGRSQTCARCAWLYAAVQIESTQAESQWIVEQVYSQHLQYLEAIKSSAKDLSLPIFEIAMDQKAHMK